MPDVEEVWFVASGEYSGYSVNLVFASEELADAYVEARKGSGGGGQEPFVEEGGRPVIRSLPDPVPYLEVTALIGPDGAHEENETLVMLFPGIDDVNVGLLSVNEHVYQSYKPIPVIMVQVTGTEIDRVRKVFSERRAQCIAMYREKVAADMARRESYRMKEKTQ